MVVISFSQARNRPTPRASGIGVCTRPRHVLRSPGSRTSGLALWAVRYAGWLPLLDIHHPTRDQPRRVEAMVIAGHVVYGATLGLTRDMLRRSVGARF